MSIHAVHELLHGHDVDLGNNAFIMLERTADLLSWELHCLALGNMASVSNNPEYLTTLISFMKHMKSHGDL